jgi:hypothetical protein
VKAAIEVEQAYRVDLREVSGLGWRRDPATGRPDLLAVGDSNGTLVTARFGGAELRPTYTGVRGLPRHLTPHSGVEWEAVAGDAAGRVLIVRESGSGLVVLAPDLTFEVDVALRHDWSSAEHLGLESLLLLRSGHLLCAKQEHPVVLVEFAPKGHRAHGFGPEQLLGLEESFDVPDTGSALRQVAVWELGSDVEGLASINDLAVDGDGKLMAVSSRSERVARLEPAGPGADRVEASASWALAVTQLDRREGPRPRTEGLLIHPQLGSFVSVDTHDQRADNLYRITPPWAPPAAG